MEIQQGFFLFQTSDNGKLKFHVEFKNFFLELEKLVKI